MGWMMHAYGSIREEGIRSKRIGSRCYPTYVPAGEVAGVGGESDGVEVDGGEVDPELPRPRFQLRPRYCGHGSLSSYRSIERRHKRRARDLARCQGFNSEGRLRAVLGVVITGGG